MAAPPGTLEPPPGSRPSEARVVAYGPETLIEEPLGEVSRLAGLLGSQPVVWIDVVGLGSVELLQQLGDQLGLHHLALEDVLNVGQRPKAEEYEDHHFVVARMPISSDSLETEQLSVFVGKDYVVTFQEQPGDCFGGIRDRLRAGRPRIRRGEADYLAYCIVDALVDSYFPLLEHIGASLEQIEDRIHENPRREHIRGLHALKQDLVTLRRFVWPLREMIGGLLRQEDSFLSQRTRTYMRDCHDHAAQALDLVDSYRDIASGVLDYYLSLASQRMNEVMKVLTVISTLFIPLSFIAGLYGMNFDREASRWNMPELYWPLGYPFALSLMLLSAAGMIVYFWRKGWLR